VPLLTDDFSYRLGDAGFILNPDDITPPFVDITDVRGFDNAPIRTTERDHEGTDGGFMDAELERGRPISLEGMAYADGEEVESLLDRLKEEWAPSRTPVPLYFKVPGVGERLFFVKPLGCRYDVNQLRRVGCTAIQFQAFAEDPRAYDSTLQDVPMGLGAIQTDGFGFPLEFPFGFGALSSTDDGTWVTNAGNRATPVKLIIPGPVSGPRVFNETVGAELRFDITLDAPDFLVVDTQYRTVLLNGTVNRRTTLEQGNWFFLQKGDNFLRYRAGAVTASVMSVQYRHAWR
jgi:hypothetical protein